MEKIKFKSNVERLPNRKGGMSKSTSLKNSLGVAFKIIQIGLQIKNQNITENQNTRYHQN